MTHPPDRDARIAELARLLDVWFHPGTFDGGFIEIAVIPPRPAGPFCSTTAEAARRALSLAGPNVNVYFGLQPRRERLGSGGLGTAENGDVASIIGIAADIDCHGERGHRTKESALTALRVRLPTHLHPPILIDSGHGYWAMWPFREPLPVSDQPRYAAIGARLAACLGSDTSAYDLRRIARAVGTQNWRTARSPVWAQTVALEPHRQFSLDDFDDWLPPLGANAIRVGSSRALGAAAALPRELAPAAIRVLEAMSMSVLSVTDRRTGGLKCVKIVGPCPACQAIHEEKAWVTPAGRLKCWRESCPAGAGQAGVDESGNTLGLELVEWVARFAPHASSALRPPTPNAVGGPDRRRMSRDEAAVELDRAIGQGLDWVAEPQFTDELKARLCLVSSPPGLGKSRAFLTRIARQRRGTFLALSHALLDEKEDEATKLGLGARRRHWGTLRRRDAAGALVCPFADQLRPFAESGYPIRSTACDGCPRKVTEAGLCPAFAGSAGRGPRFATHDHGPILGDKMRPPVVIDELPALLDRVSVPVSHLANLVGAAALGQGFPAAWMSSRAAAIGAIVEIGLVLLSRWNAREGRDRRFTWRVTGAELLDAYRAALTTPVPQQLDAFAPGPDRGRLAEAEVARIRSQLALAHATAPEPPPPRGSLMRGGQLQAENYPRRDLDKLLLAILSEMAGSPADGSATCLAVHDSGVALEWRARKLPRWKQGDSPFSAVVLDATSNCMEPIIRAAAPHAELRFTSVDCKEDDAAVRRVHLVTKSASRGALFDRRQDAARGATLSARGARALVRLLDQALRMVAASGAAAKVAFISHRPLAEILLDCIRSLDGDEGVAATTQLHERRADALLALFRAMRDEGRIGELAVLWYGNARGSNAVRDFDAVILVGDPCPNVGDCTEDARALGVDVDLLVRCLMDAEVIQALGRIRAVWRTPENQCSQVYIGREFPAGWRGLPAEVLAMPGGGPAAADDALAVNDLAADMIHALGAATPALVAHLVDDTDRPLGRGIRDTTANRGLLVISSYVANSLDGLQAAASLNPRALQRAFEQTLGHYPIVHTPRPRGPGRWTWREARPGAAAEIVDGLRLALRSSTSGTD